VSSAASEPQLVPIAVPEVRAGRDPLLLVQWLVDPQTHVLAGDRIAEILTAGIVFQVPAPVAGVLSRIQVGMRTQVSVGDILGWIDPAGD
jgi:pyruvate/2-oxoglutarate dehydrogenase complex dihydrolipoamide acyltransferase (E2) component